MGQRYTHEYFLTAGTNDGYVNHTLSTFDNTGLSLILYWNFWDDDGFCDWFMSFEGITIPKDSIIISATLRFNVYLVDPAGYVETELKAALGNTIPTDYASFDAMVGTENYTNIHLDPTETEQIVYYDVTSILQEKVNAQDWAEGNNVIFFTENSNGETADSGCDIDTYEYYNIAQLTISFEPPEIVEVTDVLNGSRVETFKYERLTLQNGTYKHYEYIDNYIESANIKFDFDKSLIGSANFKMKDYADINFFSDLIRPYYIVTRNGIDYQFPLGTYMLLSPDRDSDGKVLTRDIQANDLLYALEQDKTTTSSYYEAGDNVTDAVKALLDSVGSWVIYSIPDSDEVLAEDMSYEVGRSKLFIINSLLNTINYYPLWATGTGVYRSIPWSDNPAKIWTFEDNESSLYESGIKQNIDYSEAYNKVVVIAKQLTSDTEPLYKVWTFEDEGLESHPLSYTNIGRYIVKKFDSEATTQSYVDARARREILKMVEIEESIDYSHAFVSGRFNDGLPYQGDSFNFKNTLLDLDYTYKIIAQSWQLKTGSMVKSIIRRVANV